MTDNHDLDPRLDEEIGGLEARLFDAEYQVPDELMDRVIESIDDAKVSEDQRVGWWATLPIAIVVTGGVGFAAAPQPSLVVAMGLSIVAVAYARSLSSLLTDAR